MSLRKATQVSLAALIMVSVAAPMTSAQVVAYRHRSTVLGDHLAGYAEVLHADGLNARNRALAYQTIIRTEREREVLRQERLAAYHYEQEFAEQQIRDKALENRARQQHQQNKLDRTSEMLLHDIQTGRNVWPAALRQPEFAGYMLQLEAILRDFDAPYPSDIRALRIASEELRNLLTNATNISFRDRVEAISTVKQIENLAYRTNLAPAGAGTREQLAAR